MTRIIHSKPSLTIFADASIYHQQGVAGWGGWARGDGRDATLRGGPLDFTPDSTVGELWALALMLQSMAEDGYMASSDQSILLQSDSLQGLRMLRMALANSWVSARDTGSSDIRKANVTAGAIEPVNGIVWVLADRQVVYLRHVKGHRGGRTPRSWVNEQCDLRAKAEAMKQVGAF